MENVIKWQTDMLFDQNLIKTKKFVEIEVLYQIINSCVLMVIKSCSEKQKLLEVASTEKSCSKRQKLLKSYRAQSGHTFKREEILFGQE